MFLYFQNLRITFWEHVYCYLCTINVEGFTWLNFHRFRSFGKTFVPYVYKIFKQHHYMKLVYMKKCSQKNFHGTLEHYKNCRSLAQQIFPHLWYILNRKFKRTVTCILNTFHAYMYMVLICGRLLYIRSNHTKPGVKSCVHEPLSLYGLWTVHITVEQWSIAHVDIHVHVSMHTTYTS